MDHLITCFFGTCIFMVLLELLRKHPPCPRCGRRMPAYSRPSSFRSWLLSRRTCPSCGADISWFGTLIK